MCPNFTENTCANGANVTKIGDISSNFEANADQI